MMTVVIDGSGDGESDGDGEGGDESNDGEIVLLISTTTMVGVVTSDDSEAYRG